LNGQFGISFGLLLSRLPPESGYRAADWLADRISSMKKSVPVRAVRANQWVIHEQKPSRAELDSLTALVYRSAARSLYEFWHFIGDPPAIDRLVQFDPSFLNCIQQARDDRRGLLLVLPHLANFDLVGQAVALRGIQLHVLSYPNPPDGYRIQNRLRQHKNLKITPLSIESLRLASETLRAGGIVTSGMDRPLGGENGKYPVSFFGRPAFLPVFHIRLALKHNAPIAVIGASRMPDGRYLVRADGPFEMQHDADLVAETVHNAETILKVAAGNICQVPEQWAMFYPVWPEALSQMPA
jgi:KDO2-lipid IV(A) lauroyltransferase